MTRTEVLYGSVTMQVFTPATPGSYPGIVWLHGLNGSWDGDSGGIGQRLRNGLEVPYVVYCPQNPNQADWSANENKSIKAQMELGNHTAYIVTGHSQGGMGTMGAINLFPDFWFAAGICAGKTGTIDYIKFINIHIRAWHGEQDDLMGYSMYRFIDGVATAGGDATLIKYPTMGHGICSTVYNPTLENNFWTWLASKFKVLDKVLTSEVEDSTRLKITTTLGKVYYQQITLQ